MARKRRDLVVYARPRLTEPSPALGSEDPVAAAPEAHVPSHQRAIARLDGREDEEYNRDVENIAARPSRSSNPLSLMIRLSAESNAFYRGAGWRAYDDYIGTPILYPSYRQEIRQQLLNSERVTDVIRRLAVQNLHGTAAPPLAPFDKRDDPNERLYVRRLSEQARMVHAQAEKYIDGLIADLSNKTAARLGAFVVNNILVRMYNQGIHIKASEFAAVKEAAEQAAEKKQSVLFLPCHKSHVDYIVISYIFYRLGIALPHIAAGDNLNLPFVGWALRYGGAFFIRRSFGNDPLYQEIVKEYVELLLHRGHNIEVFTEGTRSRTGKLLAPRLGILKIALEAVLAGRVQDCVIVPMSIGYDKVIETETYVNELLGQPKEKESLAQILNSASLLRLKLGRIDIRFAKPYSLRTWIDDEVLRRSSHITLFSPLSSALQKSVMLQSLGFRVLSDINSVTVIMPTALVGTVILTLRGRGVGRTELIRRVTWLRREILIKGGKVADFGGAETSAIVDRAVVSLSGLIGIRKDLLEPVFHAVKRFELSFYRNQVIHLFIHESIVAVAMYSKVKKGQTHRSISRSRLLEDIKFLSQVFKGEFIYRPGSIEENTETTLKTLVAHGVIEVGTEGESMSIQTDPPVIAEQHVRLSALERSIGRENFDFYCFLIWPFVETYWLAAISLFCLIPTPKAGGFTEREIMERIQLFGRTLYYEGDLGYFESINKETLRNALYRYLDMGIVSLKRPPTESTTLTPLWAVQPPVEEEVLRFWDKPFPADAAYQDSYQTMDISDPKSIYETKLWRLVETISKFRREGKHRRDNKITGQRTLRIAKMAGVNVGQQKAATL